MPGILAACVLVAALVAVPPAPAGTVERDEVDSADVSFLAGPGEANRVVVREDAAGVHFSDPGALLTTRTCLSLGPHEVLCPGLSETLVVETGDGDDTIDVAAAPTAFAVGGDGDDAIVAARGSGGPGNDVLRGLATGGDLHGGPGDDTVLGGPSRDVIRGAGGNDVVDGGDGDDVLWLEEGDDRVEGGRGNDSFTVARGARGRAVVTDGGGDARDTIAVGCSGARLTASPGVRDRVGRYALPGGSVEFAGLDGTLPCETKRVPRVVGRPLATARRILAAAGFEVGPVSYRRSASALRGTVVSQRPGPRTVVRVGAAVRLVVSSGRGR